jgi:hypothetical protein
LRFRREADDRKARDEGRGCSHDAEERNAASAASHQSPSGTLGGDPHRRLTPRLRKFNGPGWAFFAIFRATRLAWSLFARHQEAVMDFVYLAAIVTLCAIAAAMAIGCARLAGGQR